MLTCLRERRLTFFVAVSMLCLSCGPSDDQTPPDQVYALRGVVQALPRAGKQEISIHHEAVPGFVNSEGEVVGMDAMTMPFHLADEETIDDLAPGDKISFDLEVRWSGRHLVTVRNVVELPADTVLDFEAPPSDKEGGDAPAEEKASGELEQGHDHHAPSASADPS